jgi:hypothetical protein
VSVSALGSDTHAPPDRRNRPSCTAALAAVALALTLLSGCGGGDDYCDAVKSNQAKLTDVTASATPGALLQALPIFRDLSADAPDDIQDDWKALLDPLQELDDALHAAGIDPATYDGKQLPDDLTDDQRTRVEDAAAALLAPSVVQAFDSVQQQAKDVCHTPLSL